MRKILVTIDATVKGNPVINPFELRDLLKPLTGTQGARNAKVRAGNGVWIADIDEALLVGDDAVHLSWGDTDLYVEKA